MKSQGLKNPYPQAFTGVRYLAPVLLVALCALAGGSLAVVRGEGPAQNVVWVNQVNTSAAANTLQKTSGQWDAGANSQQQISSQGGYVEFGVSMNHRMQVGLSNDASDAVDYTQLKYTFNFWGGVFDIREGWENNYGWWPYQAGDVFRIEVNGGVVRYYRNGVLLRESTRTPSHPLVLDTALTATGATVHNAVIYAGSPPSSGSSAAGVKTDFGIYPEPPLPVLPAKGQKFNDPTFGTQIMRVTDPVEDGESNGTWYTFWPSFNSDNTRLLARVNSGRSAVYDFNPATFTLGAKHFIPQVAPGIDFLGESATWSSFDPNLLYGVGYYGSPQKIVAYNATTHTISDVYTFGPNELGATQYLWQMTMSSDDNTFAFTIKDRNLTQQVGYLVWRRPSPTAPGQVILKVDDQTINEVSVDKTGRYLSVPLDNPEPGTGDVAKIYDLNNLQAAPVGLKPGPPDYPMGHGDFGKGIAVGWDSVSNRYMRRDLASPHSPREVFKVGGYWQSSHLSLSAADDTWSLVSFYDGYEPLVGSGAFQREVILMKNDPNNPNQVRRLLHHRSHYATEPGRPPDKNYWDIPRANLSPNGEFLAFSSNWGGSDREDLFVARVPPVSPTEHESAPPAPTNGTLPPSWLRQDIGEVGKAGASGHADGVFTLYGAGMQIWGGSDGLHYVYRQLSGDTDVLARVSSLDYGTPGASAGVMIREGLSPGSRHAYVAVSRELEVFFNYRPVTNDNSFGQSGGKPLTTFWVKLSRRGNVFTAYRSDNGWAWTPIGEPRTISMGLDIYAGLAVNSNDNVVLRQAQFDNVCAAALCKGMPPPPTNLRYVQTSTGAGFTTNGILSWNDNSDDETGFVVESRPADSTQGGWTQLAQVGPDVTTYNVSASGPGLAFRVKALTPAGSSAYSNVIVVSGPCEYVEGADSKRIKVCYSTDSCTPPAGLIIGEFRLRGAAGARDEYVELYNNSDSPITVCTADDSGGWTLAARSQGGSSAGYIFTIPNGTVIPGRGHFLGVNASPSGGYSLGAQQGGAAGDVTYTTDIQDDAGLALFMTANPDHFTAANRLDAAGFGGAAGSPPDLYREGVGLSAVGSQNGEYAFLRKMSGASNNLPQDTGDNAADFLFVATDGAVYNGSQARLGAPGPENLASPVQRNSSIAVTRLDTSVTASEAPNRVRDLNSDPANNSTFGTLSLRRRVTNNTNVGVTRLRFRVVDLTTFPAAASAADLRPLTSGTIQVTVEGVTRTVQGTALEQPPAQPAGGGYNTAMTVGVVNLAQPLAPGASVDVQFLLGVEKTGSFYFYINVEASP